MIPAPVLVFPERLLVFSERDSSFKSQAILQLLVLSQVLF